MISRAKKIEILKNIKKKIDKAKSIVFTDFTGLTVSELEMLRRQFREHQIDYYVIKKKLVQRIWPNFDAPQSVAIALSYDDEIRACSVLSEFADKHDKLRILYGMIQNEKIDLQKIQSLAKFKSHESALRSIALMIKSPINKLILCLKQKQKQ